MTLLDTDVCVAYLRGVPDVVAHLHRHLDEDVGVSFMTAAELFYGAAKAERRDEATLKVEEFLSLVEIAQSDMAVLKAFGQAKAILERAGLPIPDADIHIAATALCRNASLATGNLRHFSRIPGLRLQNWFAP